MVAMNSSTGIPVSTLTFFEGLFSHRLFLFRPSLAMRQGRAR